jgi:hypothetical protein
MLLCRKFSFGNPLTELNVFFIKKTGRKRAGYKYSNLLKIFGREKRNNGSKIINVNIYFLSPKWQRMKYCKHCVAYPSVVEPSGVDIKYTYLLKLVTKNYF